jgi:hypothetical protein
VIEDTIGDLAGILVAKPTAGLHGHEWGPAHGAEKHGDGIEGFKEALEPKCP